MSTPSCLNEVFSSVKQLCYFEKNSDVPRQITPTVLKLTIEETKETIVLSLFLSALKEKTIKVSFR